MFLKELLFVEMLFTSLAV